MSEGVGRLCLGVRPLSATNGRKQGGRLRYVESISKSGAGDNVGSVAVRPGVRFRGRKGQDRLRVVYAMALETIVQRRMQVRG